MLVSIQEAIQKIRPQNSTSTHKQHARLVHKIYKQLWPEDTEFNPDKIIKCPTDILLKCLPKDCSMDVKKGYASAIGIFSKREELSNIVTKANNTYRTRVNAHIPSESEKMNHIFIDELNDIHDRLKEEYDTHTYDGLKNYLLFCLISGRYIPPRRLLDWIAFKIHHVDENIDNYIDYETQEFVFNQYKTVKIYGEYRIRIPDPLYNILCQYIARTTSDYLFGKEGKPCSNTVLSMMINKLSGHSHGHSVNQYRKCYLQKNFGNIINLQETMRQMSSSSNCINSYIKDL
jgi:hypothetical protein